MIICTKYRVTYLKFFTLCQKIINILLQQIHEYFEKKKHTNVNCCMNLCMNIANHDALAICFFNKLYVPFLLNN